MEKNYIFLLIFFSASLFAQNDTSITFSEVMFSPQSGNNEFIEIYNLSETESFDLNNYQIKYHTSNVDVITDGGSGTILQPNSFAVILEGDYDINSGIYIGLIPQNALILKISDNAFGSNGMANGSSRVIQLINPSNDTIDVYTYSANNSTAISDEKLIMNKDNSQENWGNSLAANGTPGLRNSVSPITYDLIIASVSISPETPLERDDIFISAVIKNSGINPADFYSVDIFNDLNFDSVDTENEKIFSQNFSAISPGDSSIITTNIFSASQGNYQLIVKIDFEEDEDLSNNIFIYNFSVLPPGNNYNDVIINEIMYAPSSGEPEWIELFNRSESEIIIKNWKIFDNSASTNLSDNTFINPQEFLIISRDSSITDYYEISSKIITSNIPSLNNSGDAVLLKDSLGVLIDSISYLPSWGGTNGYSLERISADSESNNPENWKASQSLYKATPGKINSVTPKNYDLTIASFTSSKNYAIKDEEISVQIIIKNSGINSAENFSMNIYNDINNDSLSSQAELIKTINYNILLPDDSIIVNEKILITSNGKNYFIASVSFQSDEDLTNNHTFFNINSVEINEVRNDITINEFMYAPDTGQPEWIEVYNKSDKIINIKNYKVSDNSDTVIINDKNLLINPSEFLIISRDSSINNFFTISSKIIYGNFPTLNNGGDKIILIDSLNRVIDSLEYFSTWGGSSGKSLERINYNFSSTDSLNWLSSKSKSGATPGDINSVTQKDFDIEIADIIFSPEFPVYDDNISVSINIKNPGKNIANFSIDFFEDINNDSIPDNLLESSSNHSLNSLESVEVRLNYTISNLQSPKYFYASLVFNQDQDKTNNYFYKIISPGYPASTILINEIMYNPSGGEPEWIELYNTSGDSINLKEWSLNDVITTPFYSYISQDIFIPARSFFVIAADSTITNYHRIIPAKILAVNLPNLNNDEDGIVLKDNRQLIIDSVFYSKDWNGIRGYSLERVSLTSPSIVKSNWSNSTDILQSTPGRINSITSKQYDLSVADINFNPEFPVPGENIFISAVVKNNGSLNAENFSIQFFTGKTPGFSQLQLLNEVNINLLPAGDSIIVNSGVSISNLLDKTLTAVKIIFNSDEDSLNNYAERFIEPGFARNSILINEIMFNPLDEETEWVEIINNSDDTLNLRDWSVSDILSTPAKNFITNSDLFLAPDELFIIAADTSKLNYKSEVKSKAAEVNFGTLGNTQDGIIIYDFRNAVIDSFFYRSSWRSVKGYSLERVSTSAETNDSTNWVTSLSENRATPGKENSIINIPSFTRNSVIINEILYEPDIDNSEFIEFYNASDKEINIGGWRIEDEKGNFNKIIDINFTIKSGDFFTLFSDSLGVKKYNLESNHLKSVINKNDLGLINSERLILLKDIKGNIIDSVKYFSRWHNRNFTVTKNRSLERINPFLNGNDPGNWSTSTDQSGATPGRVNSIYTSNELKEKNISASPNPFSPDDDGFEDFSIINYSLTQAVSQIRIKIYDSRGRLLRTLANNIASGSKGSIIFDGRDDRGEALRMGIYIVFLEALNETSGVIENLKTVVVVARKL